MKIHATAIATAVIGLVCTSVDTLAAETILDNSQATFTGSWAASTTGQFQGINHYTATGMDPGRVVDNTSAAFKTQGAGWQLVPRTDTFGPDVSRVGTNYQVTTSRYPTVIIDNTTYDDTHKGCLQSTTNTASGYYGRDYVRLEPNNAYYPKKCSYFYTSRLSGNSAGTYPIKLFAQWPGAATHASNAKIIVTTSGGTVLASYVVNQKTSSNGWYPLGTLMNPGGTNYITISAEGADGTVAADAIKIEAADLASTNLAKWTLPKGLSGNYDIYARWPDTTSSEAQPAWVGGGGW